MAKKTSLHGHTITYDENALKGITYLREDLSSEETRVFFDQARSHGSAQFEDDNERQFTLIYQRSGYTLVRR